MTVTSRFNVTDKAVIDDGDLIAVVTGVLVRYGNRITYEMSWIQAGASHVAWIEEFRLSYPE